MEVTCEVQIEQGLSSRAFSQVLNFALRIELSARPFGPAFAFHLQSVVMFLCNAAHDGAVVPVSVSSFREDCRGPVELNSLRAADWGTSHVRLHEEIAYTFGRFAPRYIGQSLVEILEFCC